MKKSLLLTTVLCFSMLVVACNDDDGQPNQPNTPASTDPSVAINISGAITDEISFTIPNGVVTTQSIIGSYTGTADLLSINIMELPVGFSFTILGNKDSFGQGEYVANGTLGYGAYVDANSGAAFIGTASTVTLTDLRLVQDVVQATYTVNGTFNATMEDQSTPPQSIVVMGSFENITIGVNE